jgi:hypothetical protein
LDALGPAQFQGYNQFNVGGPPILDVLLQAYMDGSGETWNILVDLPLKNEEKWNVTVLCFKRADYMLSENPPLIFGEITLPGGISNHAGTGISSADYRCAISGFSAERGDINLSSLNNISPSTTADPLFIRMIPENGIYNIWADIDTRTRDEDWQVKYWCARIPYGVSGTPPP